MIEEIAKWIVIGFALFLIGVGVLMFLRPQLTREFIRKAGSTPLINYGEITLRMIPAIALICSSGLSKITAVFYYTGWFMVLTSLVLYIVPRRTHHQYALWCASFLSPTYLKLLAPLTILLGAVLLWALL